MERKGLGELIDEIEKRLTKEKLNFFKCEDEWRVKSFREIMEANYRNLYLNKNFEDCLTCSEIFINAYKDKFEDAQARKDFIKEFKVLFSEEKPSKINCFLKKHKLTKEVFFSIFSNAISFLFTLLISLIF